ncbi:hypothetical protein Tco_1225739 [Tanacetum coccineum]
MVQNKIFCRKDNVYVRWSPGRSSESNLQVPLTNVDLTDCRGPPVVNVDEPAFSLCGYQVAAPVLVNNMDTPAACSSSSRSVHVDATGGHQTTALTSMNNMDTPHTSSISNRTALADVTGARNNLVSSDPSIRSNSSSGQSDPICVLHSTW